MMELKVGMTAMVTDECPDDKLHGQIKTILKIEDTRIFVRNPVSANDEWHLKECLTPINRNFLEEE